jgi:type 1 glutamine amidotransferase
MPAKSALIVWGGWDGHEPEKVALFFEQILKEEGFGVEVSPTLDAFADEGKVLAQTLLVPIVTMSDITPAQRDPVLKAVSQHGIGLAGCHGGMCDAFRLDTEWQFMTGAQWVSHPGNDGVKYPVNIGRDVSHPITAGLDDFEVCSEQYYLHIDPGTKVLATTPFPTPGVDGPHVANPCQMPVVFTKMYGKGRVFYNSLGHHCDVLEAPIPRELMRRGFLWASGEM